MAVLLRDVRRREVGLVLPPHRPAGADRRSALPRRPHATAHAAECAQLLDEVFAQRTLADWTATLAPFEGAWGPMRRPSEMHAHPQVLANGFIARHEGVGGDAFGLVAPPMQFDREPTGRPVRLPSSASTPKTSSSSSATTGNRSGRSSRPTSSVRAGRSPRAEHQASNMLTRPWLRRRPGGRSRSPSPVISWAQQDQHGIANPCLEPNECAQLGDRRRLTAAEWCAIEVVVVHLPSGKRGLTAVVVRFDEAGLVSEVYAHVRRSG